MLFWQANFQIPNSGVQTAEVYVEADLRDDVIEAVFYGDRDKANLLFSKEYEVVDESTDVYEYLLSLDDFANYTKV